MKTEFPRLIAPVSVTDHTHGPLHAPVTIIEYGDFQCPNCKQAAPVVKMLLARFAGRLLFVFRHFPLEDIHPHALPAAEAAECAGAQDRFWEMHDLLFENQLRLDAAHLRSYAVRLGLDTVRFTAEMDEELYRQRVREHVAGGLQAGVRTSPAFFIDGRVYETSFGLNTLHDAVSAALQSHRQSDPSRSSG
jgi:protein-disulfide isomerase